MNIVIPVFPTNEVEKELMWEKIGGEPLISCTLKRLSELKGARLFVFTDQKGVAEYLRSFDLSSYYINSNPTQDEATIFPNGTSPSLKYLMTDLGISENEHFVIIDYRNPNISADIIQKAYQKHLRSKKPILFSLTEVVDHPAQLDAYYRILETDVVCLLDQDDRSQSFFYSAQQKFLESEINTKIGLSDMEVSKPFYFDWISYGITCANGTGVYARYFNEYNARMLPVEELNREELKGTDTLCLYYFESPDEARRLVDRSILEIEGYGQIGGLSFLNDFIHVNCLLLRSDQEASLFLYINENLIEGSLTVRCWPILSNPLINGEVRNYFATREQLKQNKTFIFYDCTFVGPICEFEATEGLDGYIIAVLERSGGGHADFSEPLEVKEGTWSVDPVTRKRTNLITDKKIMGRQDFPKVFRPDGSMAILNRKATYEINKPLQSNEAVGFVLDIPHSVRIQSKIDLLTLRARKKVEIQEWKLRPTI